MKDIDFDELDKAVSSLMDTTKEVSEPQESTSVKTLDLAPAEDMTAEQPESESQMPSDESTPKSNPVAPAVKRSGRFMDMVHPSSDMRSATSTTKPGSRVGVMITPPSQTETVVEIPEAPSTPEIVPPAPVESVVKHSDWPDPIDLHEKNSETGKVEEEAKPTPVDNPSPEDAEEPSPELLPANATPESPFLPDAKVEKRPLGESAPTGQLEQEGSEKASESEQTDNSIEAPMPEQPKAELPVELESNIVAVEAGGTDTASEEKEADTFPVLPSSIPQQYKEKVNTGDQEHVALYDSEGVAAPLQHPAKKKSGWLWVVWIILMIIVGAGGAFALYTFKII